MSNPQPDLAADARLARLVEWARAELRLPVTVSVASADASFRRYFRLTSGSRTWIAMDAPPDKEDVGPFLKVAHLLRDAGVNAPEALAENLAEGFLLLSDLGNRMYLAELSGGGDAARLYGDAIDTLVRMQVGCEPGVHQLPPYDAALLDREMRLFPDWYLAKHLGFEVDGAVVAVLEESFALLIESALSQPRVFVHRDYHSRNLMTLTGDANPGVLDFQDAVHGPITYDLVSLLRDCYIEWPLTRIHEWLRGYRLRAADAGLNVGETEGEFVRWFDLMGVQRHLKAIGIFARLWHRDGKRGYLQDIPRTLGYVRTVLRAYPELGSLAGLIERRIVPLLSRA